MKHQCRARSSRTGLRCRRAAIRGGAVCPMHGGRARQVKRRAAQRLRELVAPALRELESAMDGPDPRAALVSAIGTLRIAAAAGLSLDAESVPSADDDQHASRELLRAMTDAEFERFHDAMTTIADIEAGVRARTATPAPPALPAAALLVIDVAASSGDDEAAR